MLHTSNKTKPKATGSFSHMEIFFANINRLSCGSRSNCSGLSEVWHRQLWHPWRGQCDISHWLFMLFVVSAITLLTQSKRSIFRLGEYSACKRAPIFQHWISGWDSWNGFIWDRTCPAKLRICNYLDMVPINTLIDWRFCALTWGDFDRYASSACCMCCRIALKSLSSLLLPLNNQAQPFAIKLWGGKHFHVLTNRIAAQICRLCRGCDARVQHFAFRISWLPHFACQSRMYEGKMEIDSTMIYVYIHI